MKMECHHIVIGDKCGLHLNFRQIQDIDVSLKILRINDGCSGAGNLIQR